MVKQADLKDGLGGAQVRRTRRLQELDRSDAAIAGHKAANLGALASRGLPVPPGVVIVADESEDGIDAAVAEAIAVLGEGPLAVRSSALAEDLDGASFAGQYETVLDVSGAAAVAQAVRSVREGVNDERVAAYRLAHGPSGANRIAVLLMPMVEAEASGVAFTAHPLTGEREVTVVTATAGLGEQLVGGEATGEQWLVRDGQPVRDRRAQIEVLDEAKVIDVARLARRVEELMGGIPQDIEWAFAGGKLHLLQARPMTALPEPVRWESSLPGGWTRNFRLGEWLPEPVTPLSATWLLPRLEETFATTQRAVLGVETPRPLHVLINGWYFYSTFGSGGAWRLLGVLRRPRYMWSVLRLNSQPELMHRIAVEPATRAWRDELLPRSRARVEQGEREVDEMDDEALARLIDDIADIAGEYLCSMTVVAGHAWKMESVLADFYARHLGTKLGGHYQTLVAGLVKPLPPAPHAIQSFDWFRPTAGELGAPPAPPETVHRRLVAERERAEHQCRDSLPPKLRARFDLILELAQLYTRLREEQVSQLTLGWPLARRALHRLGESCARRGVIDRAEDVHFLERGEIDGVESRISSVAERRELWARNRRLTPPLVVGTLPKFVTKFHEDAVAKMRTPARAGDGMLEGMPASPGRVTGTARVIKDLADADRLLPGEILVTAATTPAWTPLFGRAAGVVTDGGSLVAHASLVAREYGIPAVVALGDATRRLRDGQRITVDGHAGVVELHE
jgi:pyruvate,water dikinase